MIAVCTPDFFERVRGFGLESELPVFVVGLPRSGTTLIEQILASHSQVFGAGEIKLARDTMAALGGQGADSIEGLRQLDRQTARRLASRHLERLRALDPHGASHRGQDAGELLVSGSVGEPVSAGEVHSLPPRFARRGRLLLDDAFPGSSLGQRPAAHCFTISRVPTDDGALAEGLAGAPVGSGLRGDGGRSGRRGPKARGLVRPGLGASAAWSSTRRSGRSERPAPSRCASRSSGHRWEDGSTTNNPWLRCWPQFPADTDHSLAATRCGRQAMSHNLRYGNDFRSIGDCDPAPSRRPAASCRADLSADSRGRAESSRRAPSSRRACFPSGQA